MDNNEYSEGEKVYSLRHNKYGIVKDVDAKKGLVISFSKNKFDYEYHYPNEVTKHRDDL